MKTLLLPRTWIISLGLAGLLGGIACDDDNEPLGSPSAGAGQTSTSGDEPCSPGHLACECAEGDLCLKGLECIEGLCVEESEPTGSGDTTGGGGATEGDGGEPVFCETTEQCAQTEVCFFGECLDTDTLYFTVEVARFDPPDCLDGFGSAELIFYYYEDATLMYSSTEALCPGSWPGETMLYDSLKDFELEFWESDAFENDYITSLCWLDPLDLCGPVPKEVLHDGIYSGFDGDYYLEITFTPTL